MRDALLGIPHSDVDIEVHGVADLSQVEKVLLDDGMRVDSVGRSFGVLKVMVEDETIDVSVPRRDVKTGSGHRSFDVVVDPSMGEIEATARRDLTINALMWDPRSEEVIDAHGGLIDLDSRVLRHVGPAFAEDPLRVLRAVQFAGRLGFAMADETVELARSLVSEFSYLPKERVWAEWAKLLGNSSYPGMGLSLLAATRWNSHFPELVAVAGVPQDRRWHPEGSVDVHTRLAADAAASIARRHDLQGEDRLVLVAAALTHDFGKATHTQVHDDGRITSFGHAEAGVAPAKEFLDAIGCPSRISDQVLPLVREHMCATTSGSPTKSAVRRLARRLGDAPIEMWAMVVEADHQGRAEASSSGPAYAWVDLAREISVLERPVSAVVTGRDLIAAGLSPGPAFKSILAAAVAAQDDGVIVDHESGVGWLASHLASTSSDSSSHTHLK